MKRQCASGALIIAIGGYAGAGNAQQNCEQQIQELRSELERQNPGAARERQIEQLLAQAQGSENCEGSVAAAGRLIRNEEAQQIEQQSSQQQMPAEQLSEQGQVAADRQGAQAPSASAEQTEIEVQQRAAQVEVQAPPQQVQVQQQPAQVTVRQQQPDVTITQPEPEVTVRQEEPQVSVSQAEPQVEVQQSEPEVEIVQSEPEVQVVQPGAEGGVTQAGRNDAQVAGSERQVTRGAEISETEAASLVGRNIETREGDDIGEVTEVVRSQAGQYFAVADIGGFLGIGSETKAIPFESLEFDTEGNLVSLVSRDQLERMQTYDEERYQPLQAQEISTSQWPAFEEVDRDGDGGISQVELAMIEGADFTSLDRDQDGALDRQEYQDGSRQ